MEFKQFILESYKSIALHFDHTTLYNTALKFLNMHFHFSTIGSIENKYCGLIATSQDFYMINEWSMIQADSWKLKAQYSYYCAVFIC